MMNSFFRKKERRRLFPCRIENFGKILRSEQDTPDDESKSHIDEREGIVQERPCDDAVRRIAATPYEDTADDVRSIAQDHDDDTAESELNGFILIENVDFFQQSRKPDGGKRDGIIQQELHRVNEPGFLNELQQAVNKTDHNAFPNAEHIGIEHEGQQTDEGNRSALRQLKQSDIRKGKAHGKTQSGVSDALGVVAFDFLSEKQGDCYDDRDDRYCADVQSEGIPELSRMDVGLITSGTADHDKRDKQCDVDAQRNDSEQAIPIRLFLRKIQPASDGEDDDGEPCDNNTE